MIHINLAHAILACSGLLGLWCLFVLVSPTGTCPACHGKRVRTRNGRRRGACKTCKATGKAARPGAQLVHRALWSVILRDRMEGRRQDIAARLKKENGS